MKNRRFLRVLTAMVLAVFGIGAATAMVGPLATTVFAEEEEQTSTLVVSPMWQTLILRPGESWTGTVGVRNPATATQNLKYSVSVGPYSEVPKDETNPAAGTNSDVTTVTSYNRIVDWITLERTSGELGPNQSEEIVFTVNVPSDAPGGGQYASIIIKDESDKNESGGGLTIQSDVQTASVLFAEVTGDTREEGSILENNVPGFLLASPLEVSSVVENTGNVHANVKYSLEVTPLGSDENICSEDEVVVSRIAMPEAKLYHTESCAVGTIGIYQAKQTVEAFGRTSEVERLVFVCPIWLLILVVIAIVVVIWLIVRGVRSRR